MTSDIEFLLMLTLCFIILKAIGAVTWPWLWVFSPVWLPIVLLFGLLLLAAAVVTSIELSEGIVRTVWRKPAWR